MLGCNVIVVFGLVGIYLGLDRFFLIIWMLVCLFLGRLVIKVVLLGLVKLFWCSWIVLICVFGIGFLFLLYFLLLFEFKNIKVEIVLVLFRGCLVIVRLFVYGLCFKLKWIKIDVVSNCFVL